MKAIKLFAGAAVLAGVLVPGSIAMAAGSYTEDLTGPQGSPNGTIFFSDELEYWGGSYTAYLARNAFDNIIDERYWNAEAKTGHIGYQFAQPQTITKYTMRWSALSGWQFYMPRDWTFEALDPVTNLWVVLDSHTNVTDWSGSLKKEYTFQNTRSYKSYRINYTRSNTTNNFSGIGEVEMMASLPSVQLDVDVSDTTLYGSENVDAYVVSRNATGLATEEVTVSYDDSSFTLGEITPEPGFTIISKSTPAPGQIKVKLTSNGTVFSTTAETRMFKIGLMSKGVNKTARIETIGGSATDSAGNVLAASFGGENVAITTKAGDLNFDGYITVSDVALAASVYGSYSAQLPNADVNGDMLVDDTDLNLIGSNVQWPVIPDGGHTYTMDLTQGGFVRASSTHSSYSYYQPKFAFDGDTTSGYYWNAGTKVPSGWLEYTLRTKMPVNKYSLLWQKHTGYESYMPKDWTFEGWDDAAQQWVVLDSRQDIAGWATGSKREFEFNNSVNYDKYRINISASNNATYVGVGEMEMFSKIGVDSPWISAHLLKGEYAAGETIEAYLEVQGPVDTLAQDATVTFDADMIDFVDAVPVGNGVKIVKQESTGLGKMHFVLANTSGSIMNPDPMLNSNLIKMNFKAKENVSGESVLSLLVNSLYLGTKQGADIHSQGSGVDFRILQP
ncbi:hypothetical protein CBW65_10210 [Tumebacillus avium]|uniref:F5/8 type C domain-containing protein n=1 Tax=Tumebacillus avium TaxID=1903704 RepID=A0A1Y0IM19_9BACL|nr:discoidin domain-containing protein [Tumebacillus avium]ARU61330.1 hypothetical protein CBW65_10210 [Tumebacillus avium]